MRSRGLRRSRPFADRRGWNLSKHPGRLRPSLLLRLGERRCRWTTVVRRPAPTRVDFCSAAQMQQPGARDESAGARPRQPRDQQDDGYCSCRGSRHHALVAARWREGVGAGGMPARRESGRLWLLVFHASESEISPERGESRKARDRVRDTAGHGRRRPRCRRQPGRCSEPARRRLGGARATVISASPAVGWGAGGLAEGVRGRPSAPAP